MDSLMPVMIHQSQFPENVRRDLRQSLSTRRVNHKFHYDSIKQTNKWLALHEAVSPARRDPDCAHIYEQAAIWLAEELPNQRTVLTSIGCGGGQKDVAILRALHAGGRPLVYLPADVSPAMTIVAAQAAASVIARDECRPVALDFANTDDLPAIIEQVGGPAESRLLAFYGMLPNFEARLVLPRLASALRPGEFLSVSANLAPGDDYHTGTARVLPQYDNAPTRDWLLTFLYDLGFTADDGRLRIGIETPPEAPDQWRIAAHFDMVRARTVRLDGEEFAFHQGESIRLFYSYRHTPGRLKFMLAGAGLTVAQEWITGSGEEGVFICCKI